MRSRKVVLTRKDPDRDDADFRRTAEIEENFQSVEHDHFPKRPSFRQLANHGIVGVEEDDGVFLYYRVGKKLFRVILEEVGE